MKITRTKIQASIQDADNVLKILVNSGISGDGFIAKVINTDDNTIFEESYYYGYNASYDRRFADSKKPYVTDIIKDICNKYNISDENIYVVPGKNVFKGTKMDTDVIEEFREEYLTSSKKITASKIDSLIKNIVTKKDFYYDSVYSLDEDEIDMFEDLGFIHGSDVVIPADTKLKYVGSEENWMLYQVVGTDYIIVFNDINNMFGREFFQHFDIAAAEEIDEELETTEQEFTSKDTSINSAKLPAIYNLVNFPKGSMVIDYGGGRYNNGLEYLESIDCEGRVYDPYNRSAEYNQETIRECKKNGGADIGLCSNVLNVIKEPKARKLVLTNMKKLVKPNGDIYITVYEGSGTGEGKQSQKDSYQLNRKTADYLEEIQEVFPDAKRKGKLIHATNSGVVQSSQKIDASHKTKFWDNVESEIYSIVESYIEPGTDPDDYPDLVEVHLAETLSGFIVQIWIDLPDEELKSLRKRLEKYLRRYDPTFEFEPSDDWTLEGFIVDTKANVVSSINAVTNNSDRLRNEIYEFLDECGGYTDYNQKIEDVSEEFGMSPDEAEGYVADWALGLHYADAEWRDTADIEESCKVEASTPSEKDYEEFFNIEDLMIKTMKTVDADVDDSQGDIQHSDYLVDRLIFQFVAITDSKLSDSNFKKKAEKVIQQALETTRFNENIDVYLEKRRSSAYIEEHEPNIREFVVNIEAWEGSAAISASYRTRHPNYCPHCTNMTLVEVEDGYYVCEECGEEYKGCPTYEGGLKLTSIDEVDSSCKVESTVEYPYVAKSYLENLRDELKSVSTKQELRRLIVELYKYNVNYGHYMDMLKDGGFSVEELGRLISDDLYYEIYESPENDLIVDDTNSSCKVEASAVTAAVASVSDLKLLMKAAINVDSWESLGDVISSLQSIDKSLYLKYSEMERVKEYSPAAIGKMISDDLYWKTNTTDAVESSTVFDQPAPYQIAEVCKEIQDDIYNAAAEVMQSEAFGFPLNEIADYLIVEVVPEYEDLEETKLERIKVEVRAELSYEGMSMLAEALDPIVQTQDPNAYFDHLTSGIIDAYIYYPKGKIPMYDVDSSCKVEATESIEAGKLIDAPQEVIDELLGILNNYGFILDSRFSDNPGRTLIMNDVHIQVINPDSHVSVDEDVTNQLREYVSKDMIDEIHALEDRSNCPITSNFGVDDNYQVTGGLDIMKQYVESASSDVEAAVEPSLEPPDYHEPGEFKETYEVEFDDVIIVEENAIDFEESDFEDIYETDYNGMSISLKIDDGEEVAEKIVELVDYNVPEEPGKYRISGVAHLTYEVTGIYAGSVDRDEYEDADVEYVTEDANIEYDPRGSWIESLQVEKVEGK